MSFPLGESVTAEYDSAWKEAIEYAFEPFMAFFFPDAYEDIDWQEGYDFLDAELQKIVPESALGRRLADKLVRVTRKSGEQSWVLVHIEVQSQSDKDFARRMFTYHYRIFDRYAEHVVSLAILGDTNDDWRPDQFSYGLWGCQLSLQFPIVKLLDYEKDEAALVNNLNPFAILVRAHLKSQATQRDMQTRLAWKIQLVKGLYQRGYERKEVLAIIRLIDWMMSLPVDLEHGFTDTIQRFEEEQHMSFVTSFERVGIEKGIQKGFQQGQAYLILKQIARRFGFLAPENHDRILLLPAAQLSELGEAFLDFEKIDDVAAWLDAHTTSV